MRGFVMLGTNDLMKSKAFYDELLSIVGLHSLYEDDKCIGYARSKGDPIEFYITLPQNGEDATFGNGTQVSFLADNNKQVEEFHATALKLGATNEGDPGFRYPGEFYAYMRDHNNNKLCAYHLSDE